MSEDQTPIWLDLKKEYVDDNFDALVRYLHNSMGKKDSFLTITQRLVSERTEGLVGEISSRPLFADDEDIKKLEFNVRLLATYLLTFPEAPDRIKVMMALIHELRDLSPKHGEGLMNVMAKCLTHRKIEGLGFTYNDISTFQREIFAHKLCSEGGVRFAEPATVAASYDNKGRLWQTEKGFTLTAPGAWKNKETLQSLVPNMELVIGCRMSTPKIDQLDNPTSIPQISAFTEAFLEAQNIPFAQPKKVQPSYAKDDVAVFEISSLSENGIWVESVDPAFKPLRAKAVFRYQTICGLTTDSLWKLFYPGDRIKAKVVDPEHGLISFEDELKECLVEATRDQFPVGSEIYAKLKVTAHGPIKYNIWLAENGVGLSTYPNPDYEINDLARLRIINYEYAKNYGKINAEPIEQITEEEFFDEFGEAFNDQQFRKEAIDLFVESTPEIATKQTETEGSLKIDEGLLPLALRVIYTHQRTLPKPLSRFYCLSNAMAIARLIGDETSVNFLRFSASYLRALVSFAANDNIHDIVLKNYEEFAETDAVKTRLEVIDILKEYGRGEYSEKLQQAIAGYAESNPNLSKLARLVQAANSIRETLTPATLNTLKREIVKNLSLETEEDVEIDTYGAQYLGIESQTVEFKTSMVYPPEKNAYPNQPQQTTNVLRAICGFLNSQIGGTVYVGVNDQGYVSGLEDDFKYLHCTNFDTYVRLNIFDKCVQRFGKDVMTYIHIEPAFNDRVAMIRVDPFPFGVIELDGKAYVRADRETREMTGAVRSQVALQKFRKDRDTAGAIDQLKQARFSRRRAILHGYSSSHSGTINDRKVEVYDVMEADDLVWCIDCDSRERRVFKVPRIQYVEVTDEPCTLEHLFHKTELDSLLHFGDSRTEVSLRLDMHAKNALVEQFPRTKDKIKKDAKDSNIWYYTDQLSPRGIQTLARFYVGQVDHVVILDSPELSAEVDAYVNLFRDIRGILPTRQKS